MGEAWKDQLVWAQSLDLLWCKKKKKKDKGKESIVLSLCGSRKPQRAKQNLCIEKIENQC